VDNPHRPGGVDALVGTTIAELVIVDPKLCQVMSNSESPNETSRRDGKLIA